MDPQDLANCREIHAGLMAKERNTINYLFLEPVETTYFPEYLKVIKKPMDLRTLKENLEAGKYTAKEEFYADAQLIFDNAIAFNKDRDSKFVVDLAKRMIRAFDRLKKKTEAATAKKNGGDSASTASTGGGTKKIKLKLKRNSSILSASSSTEEASSGTGGVAPPPNKKAKKVKLKLSLGKNASKSESKSSRSNSPALLPP
ncbi:bromodomain-containing protein [Skeletonema marinoi]|uniref:Bromodomain-containing protein n=1 Tax=Skeletonema marinoi TaxID=267567 RepID=A0AAD9DGZ3_9STRA|nr:bromodomain-containing protein [Skeletonema marinoi]